MVEKINRLWYDCTNLADMHILKEIKEKYVLDTSVREIQV